MRIVLLGAPGSGKGTHCKSIVDKYKLVHMSSGDILRQERAAGSDLGKKAQKFMDAGELVPDELIIEMMTKAIKKAPAAGYILDGFPRTVKQAQSLDKTLALADKSIDIVINLEVNDKVVEGRITGRRSCPKCGAVYHIKNIKPKKDGICDKDGEKLVQRPDDTIEVVANRLKTYHLQTEPLVDYYKKFGTVYDVNGEKDVETVQASIFAKLDEL
jgi:adenylate kinase